jgi:RNA ligase (TIGR02306 family)
MFLLFGKKKDKKNGWPAWVSKTDEERIQNMPWIINSKDEWIATEKIDGTSTTFTMTRGKFGRKSFYVCSRNVCFGEENKPCYYDTNVYWEMAKKYKIYEVLSDMLDMNPNEEWITIQGETYGDGVQKRDYSLTGRDFAAFNLICSSKGRIGTIEMLKILADYGVPCVPIVCETVYMSDFKSVDDVLLFAEGGSQKDGLPREGIVFRTTDGQKSFKAVSNSFLLKYHG